MLLTCSGMRMHGGLPETLRATRLGEASNPGPGDSAGVTIGTDDETALARVITINVTALMPHFGGLLKRLAGESSEVVDLVAFQEHLSLIHI
eukprot:7293543-Alexandrium_andersonii.AAC.1